MVLLAEIDPAGELAHDQEVEALHHLALERGGVGQRRVADRRPEIGIEREVLAEPQQPGFRPLVVRDAVPFGSADRPDTTASLAMAFAMSLSEIASPWAS